VMTGWSDRLSLLILSSTSELDEFNIRDDKVAIAKARRSGGKKSKRRIRIENSDDDDSFESGSEPSPEPGLHITLQMALGSPGSEDDEEEEDHRMKKRTHRRGADSRSPSADAVRNNEQFLSSRRFSNDNSAPAPMDSFSPGTGNGTSIPPRPTLRGPNMHSPLHIRTLPPRHVNALSPYQQEQVSRPHLLRASLMMPVR
jgi:hypothetical protein